MWIFLGVTSVMSVIYLVMNTGDTAKNRVKPAQLTPTKLEAGQVIDAGLTLITADATGLSCASDTKIGDYHCGFKADGSSWRTEDGSADKPENVLAPYMTVDNVLFLIPGLFTQPVLDKRLKDEPPGRFTRKELESRRFTVTCKLKAVEELKGFKVRWAPGQGWGNRDAAWVGSVDDCKLTGG